jgi:hypothetical protein
MLLRSTMAADGVMLQRNGPSSAPEVEPQSNPASVIEVVLKQHMAWSGITLATVSIEHKAEARAAGLALVVALPPLAVSGMLRKIWGSQRGIPIFGFRKALIRFRERMPPFAFAHALGP